MALPLRSSQSQAAAELVKKQKVRCNGLSSLGNQQVLIECPGESPALHWASNASQAASGELDKQGRDVDFASGEMVICWEKTKARREVCRTCWTKPPPRVCKNTVSGVHTVFHIFPKAQWKLHINL